MSHSEREFIGSVFTDVASLLIADPCKVLPSEGDSRKWPTYDDLLVKTFDPATERRTGDVVKLLDDAMAFSFGTDGYCHVFVERGESGEIVRVIIEPGMVAKEPS